MGYKSIPKRLSRAIEVMAAEGLWRRLPREGCEGDIFVPIIPVIAATGLFLGLKGVVFNDNVLGLFGTTTAIIPGYIKLLVNVLTETAFAYTMIGTSLLANTGFNPVITLCAMYGFANVDTCLVFFFRAKKPEVCETAIGAMMSQLFGISEPVLFGLQLRYNLRPLAIMCLTSGAGAVLLSIFGVRSNSYGLAVLPSYLMYIYEWRQPLWYFVISVVSVATCFVLTSMFAIPEEVLGEE